MELNQFYNFSTLAPVQLGAVYKGVELLAIVSYGLAKQYDVDARQRAVYPMLPQGTPVDHTKYQYYIFRTPSGDTIAFADTWIDLTSIVKVSTMSFDIQVHDATIADQETARVALVAAGITNFTIVQK